MRPPGDEEPPSHHLGDYPDGAYWSAVPQDESGSARDDRTGGRSPWSPSEPRTPENPYPIRMFAEIGCDFALWGEIDEPPPTRRDRDREFRTLEEELPISDGLREALLAWASAYFRWDGGDRTVPMDGFDERGFHLSRALQRELGELYAVRYSFTFGGPHRQALVASVADDPLPGWSVRS